MAELLRAVATRTEAAQISLVERLADEPELSRYTMFANRVNPYPNVPQWAADESSEPQSGVGSCVGSCVCEAGKIL